MDRGDWWTAIVHGVAKSWTQLSAHTHTHTHIHVLIWNFARFSKGTMIKSTPQPSDFNLQMMLTSVN